MSTKLDINGFF